MRLLLIPLSLTITAIIPVVCGNKSIDRDFSQREGAFKAAARGGTVLGLRASNMSILLSYPCTPSHGSEEDGDGSVRGISASMGFAAAGLAADASFVRDMLFDEAAEHRFVFGAEMSLPRLAASIATMMHRRTLSSYLRPLGVRIALIGVHQLLEIDPLGGLHSCRAVFMGPYAKQLSECLDKSSSDLRDLNNVEILTRGVQTLVEVITHEENSFGSEKLHIAIVGEGLPYKELSREAVRLAVENKDYDNAIICR